MSTIDNLIQQILGQNLASKWTGEGKGSTQANAADMAKILSGIGITDIKQFGEVKNYTPVEAQYTYKGSPATKQPDGSFSTLVETGQGEGETFYTRVPVPSKEVSATYGNYQIDENGQQIFVPIDQSKVTIQNGQPVIQSGTTYGNKVTGQSVPNTYSERQTGNAWGGTFSGSGNTGYRVQFGADGTPYFYTTGASSNDLFNILSENPVMNLAANAAAAYFGGPAGVAALQAAQGKDVEDIAKSAAMAYIGGEIVNGVSPEISSALQNAGLDQSVSNVAGKSITSGLLSEAQGGDFLTGAVGSAISGAANEAKIAAAEDYLRSQPVDAYDASTLPTEQFVLDAIAAEQPTYTISDATFTPDYSLTTGVPVIPEMGAQGIQVPTINEVIDVVNTPVDYSLPVPSDGLSLQMPTVPNLESMGGGQGITVPVSGGTLTEAGVITDNYVPVLGDETSFINQPAPNVEVNIPEVVEKPMTQEELNKELSKIDLAKTLAGLAAPALLAAGVNAATSGGEEQTGYGIVPIPGSWKSPEYSKAFQESAPIDFGNSELLKGTQWERYANPQTSININTLMNTLQGNPTGSFKLSDIISGIQDQYGQIGAGAMGK